MDPRAVHSLLVERFTGERAGRDWEHLLAKGYEAVLSESLEDALPTAALDELVDAVLDARLPAIARAIVRTFVVEGATAWKQDEASLGRFVPEDVETAIADLFAEPGIAQEDWIRELFAQKAAEDLVTDTLYEGLRDFSKIIPRIIQSLTPSALGKLARLGGRATGGVGGKFVEEVERRIEPEIRKFLDKGGRRALDGAANFTVAQIDQPVWRQARRNLVHFAFTRSPASYAEPADERRLAIVESAAARICETLGRDEAFAGQVKAAIAGWRTKHAGRSVEEVLDASGFDVELPTKVWARLSWPAVRAALCAPWVSEWLGELAEDIASLADNPARSPSD